jgi:hypothetical protein
MIPDMVEKIYSTYDAKARFSEIIRRARDAGARGPAIPAHRELPLDGVGVSQCDEA